MRTVAVLTPTSEGSKVTSKVALLPASIGSKGADVTLKSSKFIPMMANSLVVSVALPVF